MTSAPPPLSFRNSTLYPFNFDPTEAMAELEHKYSAPSGRSVSEGAASETPALADTDLKTSSIKKPAETRQAFESLSFTTPARGKAGIRAFSDKYASSTAFAPPSKNNLGYILKEFDSPRVKDKAKYSTASLVHLATAKTTSPSHGSLATPKKRSNELPSPGGTLRSLLTSTRSFSTTNLFSTRNKSTSGDEYDCNEIVGDLEFLCSQPPPDLSQHPSRAADPFHVKSTVPIMSTSMTISQARQWAVNFYRSKKKRWADSQKRPFVKGEPFPIFKQPGWIARDEELAPERAALTGMKTSQDEKKKVSPVPKNDIKMPKTPLRIDTKAANNSSAYGRSGSRTATPLTDSMSKRSETPSVRSFSNLFRYRRPSADTPSVSSIYPERPSPEAKKEQSRESKERYLRVLTNCPSLDYSPTSVHPRHPNTGRAWVSRNLRCAGCEWVTCGVCGRACCARAACFYAIENHKENPEGMARAQETKSMIEHLMPTDAEVQTFLQCTSCKKQVCPDCCGICPNEACQDIQCRHCKRGDPWDECEWHKAQAIRQELVSLGLRPQSSSSI